MRPKIDLQKAEEIRHCVREGISQKEMTYRTGLTKSTVSMIVANKIWKNNQEEER